MNGFKSRKFVLAALGVLAGVVAAFVLPALGPFAWLRQHSVGVFASACSLAAAYIAANVIMDRGHGGDGNGA
jgi:uncharacterized membrane protein YadS